MSRAIGVRDALAERALADPEPGVRREALRELARTHPDHVQTKGTAHQASTDPDPEVRILAAGVLGDEGTHLLDAIASDLALPDTTIASAVFVLGQRLSSARAAELLKDARVRGRFHTARACIERLGKGPADEAIGPLVEVLRLDDGEFACHAARALGALGSEGAESALVTALGRDLPALRKEAAQALGRLGSVSSVLRLKDAADRYTSDEDFGVMARRAIAAIQSRAAGADRGQLSVADDQAGQLSLAAREAGQLSVPDGERGHLSLPDPEPGPRPPARSRGPSR
jgi:HEAT repeat protein